MAHVEEAIKIKPYTVGMWSMSPSCTKTGCPRARLLLLLLLLFMLDVLLLVCPLVVLLDSICQTQYINHASPTFRLPIGLFLELDEDGVKISLTVVDTPGFGDMIDNEYW